jgi:hypothetical protein
LSIASQALAMRISIPRDAGSILRVAKARGVGSSKICVLVGFAHRAPLPTYSAKRDVGGLAERVEAFYIWLP